METKLDKFGRVLIPKTVRQKLGLEPGATLFLEERNQEIIIRANAKTNRVIGVDKGLVEIADDFDAPLDDFKEYIPPQGSLRPAPHITKHAYPIQIIW